LKGIKELLEKILISEAPIPSDIRKDALALYNVARKNVGVVMDLSNVEFRERTYEMGTLAQCYEESKTNGVPSRIQFIKNLRSRHDHYGIGLKEAKELSDYLMLHNHFSFPV